MLKSKQLSSTKGVKALVKTQVFNAAKTKPKVQQNNSLKVKQKTVKTQPKTIKIQSKTLKKQSKMLKVQTKGLKIQQNSLKMHQKNPVKKLIRRSPLMRAALQPTIMGSHKGKPPVKSQVTFKKSHRQSLDALQSLGMSRRTKLIDASPLKKNPATPVLFLIKDSKGKKESGQKKSSSGGRKQHLPKMDPRSMSRSVTRASEGVDFFYNLGMRMQPEKPKDQQVRLRGNAAFEGRLEGGQGHRPGSARTNPGLAAIVGGSSVGMSAKDVVVPLTNRLPIIDFISTYEFQNMYATTSRKPQTRSFVH
ncbi:uncharacterized protein LOC128260966 [Drosophila gunungcola]|nr:uncharacterized protein LOC128260966 [Drosophila gunungcola]